MFGVEVNVRQVTSAQFGHCAVVKVSIIEKRAFDVADPVESIRRLQMESVAVATIVWFRVVQSIFLTNVAVQFEGKSQGWRTHRLTEIHPKVE